MTPEEKQAKNKAQCSKYYYANHAERLAKNRAWREANPERSRAYVHDWIANNLEANRKRARDWGRANPEANTARAAAWVKNNPERAKQTRLSCEHRRRARLRDACSPGVTPQQWREICEQFSDGTTTFCAYCSVAPATSVDHVLAIANGGKDAPDNVVPACRSCNCSKGAKLLMWQWVGKGIRSFDVLKAARK